MKKILILILIFLIIICSSLTYVLYLSNQPEDTNIENYDELKSKILNNSEWISLSSDELNSYMFNSYSPTMEKVITSLEESVPVIFKIYGSKFSNAKDGGSFIIASSFTSNNNVYIYYYDFSQKKYVKKTTSLPSILESATSVFICTNPEVLR